MTLQEGSERTDHQRVHQRDEPPGGWETVAKSVSVKVAEQRARKRIRPGFWHQAEKEGMAEALRFLASRAHEEAEHARQGAMREGATEALAEETKRMAEEVVGGGALAGEAGLSKELDRAVAAETERALRADRPEEGGERLRWLAECLKRAGLETVKRAGMREGAGNAARAEGRSAAEGERERVLSRMKAWALRASEKVGGWKRELEGEVLKGVGEGRLQWIFEHVVDFPESKGAMEDLRGCIELDGFRGPACETVRERLQERLLHAGAATADVLTAYVGVQQALRVADPSGALARAGASLIESHLAKRADAHRQVVQALLRGRDDPLGEVLEGDLRQDASGDGPEGTTWEPKPWEVASQGLVGPEDNSDFPQDALGAVGHRRQQESLAHELAHAMAERATRGRGDWSEERELEVVELLRGRLGEGALHSAEVMAKDLRDSGRLHVRVVLSFVLLFPR